MIYALCETWLSPEDEINFRDFNIIRLDRDDSYGGVLLGIKKCYHFYRISIPTVSGIEIVTCQINVKNKDLCIASIYVPPGTSINHRQLWSSVTILPSPFLILGDMNSHGTAWGESYDDNRAGIIYDLCDDFNLTILNTGEATRIPKPPAQESRLDISLCSNSLSLDCQWKVIDDPHGSDHLPIIISIKSGCQNTDRPIQVTFDLTRNQSILAKICIGGNSWY